MAAGAARNLGTNYDNLAKSVERLSSGLRINSAKDDAAGLAVRELIRADVAALTQGARNANDGVSMLQVAEGALGQIDTVLVRMRELAEQANTDTYSAAQKEIMQAEFDELSSEIDRIVGSTDFNDINLLDNDETYSISLGQGNAGASAVSVRAQKMDSAALGVGGSYETATGPNVASASTAYIAGDVADSVDFSIGGDTLLVTLTATSMTLTEVADAINVESNAVQDGWEAASVEGNATNGYHLVLRAQDTGNQAGIAITNTGAVTWSTEVKGGGASAEIATAHFLNVDGTGGTLDITLSGSIAAIDDAIEAKDTYRAELGYKMNRLDTAASVLNVQAENLSAAESRISDVDVATEMSAMTRNQVLAQAGISMLGQANSMPQMALSLLG